MSCPVPSIKRLAGIVRASASFSDGAITIMLALHQVHHVAFASTLDRQWTLSSWKYQMGSSPPLPFRGKLYLARTVISRDDVQIFQIDTPVKDETGSGCVLLPPKLIATLPKGNIINPTRMVECDSEILVLGYKDWYLLQILVFKLTDLVLQMCIRITSEAIPSSFQKGASLSALKCCLPLWVTMLSAFIQDGSLLCNTTLLVAPGHQQPMIAACMALHRVYVASSTISSALAFSLDED
uniref:Uncharacterized protein n=1 Tax=Arundo donax TaxID=35708 RepID=A0A0A9HS30_ARUDO